MNDIVRVNADEYGVDPEKAKSVEQAFMPAIIERDQHLQRYEEIIGMVIDSEAAKAARELRLKLVPIRTGIAKTHKKQKEFALAFGKLVDAWKNKETVVLEEMESRLMDIEKHQERIEAERIAKIEESRRSQLEQYTQIMPQGLATMQDDVFVAYLAAQKAGYEAKIEAERKAEQERIEREKADAEERARIKAENERLRAEAIERDRIEKSERAEREAKELAERKERERLAKIEADKMIEDLRIAAEQARKEREEYERKIAAERAERQRIEKEAADKAAKERAEREAKEAAERDAEKQARNKAHRAKINGEALKALTMECGIDTDLAKAILTKIINGKINNVSIKY